MPYGVKFNIKAPHRFMRMGALCWLSNTNNGGGSECFQIVGMSRSGRKVTTWIDARDLTNYRVGWIPDQPRHHPRAIFPFDSREDAQHFADVIGRKYGELPVRDHAASFGRHQDGAGGDESRDEG